MADETITFEFIRRIQREEQRIQKLTKLPDNFYNTVSAYMQQKKKITLNEDRKGSLEFKNIERLVQDIFDRRERKILNLAIISARTGIPPENLTEEEKEFFNLLSGTIKRRRDESVQKIFGGQSKEDIATLLVFKEDVPEFLGSDMKNYGPFKKGDIAKLPDDNMRVMIQQGVAEEFKVGK